MNQKPSKHSLSKLSQTKNYPIWHPFTQMKLSNLNLVKSAKGAYLYLENGKKVLDLISSWWVTIHGHSHPAIAKAIYRQALQLEQVIFANFTHPPATTLIQKLQPHLPSDLNRFFFSDNGSTAVEVALKIAYQYWQNLNEKSKNHFISFEGGYHGDTVGAMSVSANSIYTDIFKKLLFKVSKIPFPATYENDKKVDEKEEYSLNKLLLLLKDAPGKYGAIIIEPLIQGAGGMRICRDKFLKKLQKIANRENILLIYDEIMTGFGRTGKWFAHNKSQTIPDILCLSKGLTGGFLPMSLTICKKQIYEAFYSNEIRKTFFHGHSYTGSPLGCAAAIASVDLLERNKNFEKLESWHHTFMDPFRKNPKVKNIRICGTMAAMDLVSSHPAGYTNPTCKKIQKSCLQNNIYLRPLGNTIYLLPPYCITDKELALAYHIIEKSIDKI